MIKRCSADITPLLLAAVVAAPGQRPAPGAASLAGLTDITESLQELTDAVRGIHSFLAGVSFISETIGFGTILLFLAVIVFSAGYSALGLPKGKASFFSSLITADALWVLWNVSFNAPPAEYIISMIRSNLIVLCPLAVVAVITRAAPPLAVRIRSGVRSLFGRRREIGAREAAALSGECQARSARLNRAVMEDILASGGTGDAVSLSAETRKSAEELREALDEFDAAAGRRKKQGDHA